MTRRRGHATSGRLDEHIVRWLARAEVPACSIAMVDTTGLGWSRGFGQADIHSGRHADADTVYRLFSGTKLFTAVAILQLEERGLLELTDPVERFLPEAEGARGISLLNLLSHRSGLKDTLRAFLGISFPPATPPTADEALARYRLVPRRPPGRRVEYRNVNYALLGAVVSRVSGLEYREYVHRHVTGPLGMRAAFRVTTEMRPRAATGYIARYDPMRFVLRLLFPGQAGQLYGRPTGRLLELREYDLGTSAIGGLVGSMPDFARFLRAHLTGGGPVLGPVATRRMQTQVAAGAAGIESRVGVGLGWKIGEVGGRTFLNHEGGGAGFTSELRLYPTAGIGIALGMNAMRMPRTMRLAHRVCEAVFAARHELLGPIDVDARPDRLPR